MVAMPVATWSPWVKRYRPAGRAIGSNQPGGFCWMCDQNPVAKQIVNVTPSAMPSHAAVRSSCSALREARSLAAFISAGGARSAGPRRPRRRRCRSRPHTRWSPTVGDRPSSTGTTVRRRSDVSARTRTTWSVVSNGSISTMSRPSVVSSWAIRVSSATGSPPMPMLPSRSSALRHRPTPGTRSNTDRSSTLTPWRAGDVEEDRRRCRSRARTLLARAAPRGDVRAHNRCRAPGRPRGRARAARPTPAAANQRWTGRSSARPSGGAEQHRCVIEVDPDNGHAATSADAATRVTARANADLGTVDATLEHVGERVDVAEPRSDSPTRSPRSRSRASWHAAVLPVDIGTPANAPRRRSRKPIAQ